MALFYKKSEYGDICFIKLRFITALIACCQFVLSLTVFIAWGAWDGRDRGPQSLQVINEDVRSQVGNIYLASMYSVYDFLKRFDNQRIVEDVFKFQSRMTIDYQGVVQLNQHAFPFLRGRLLGKAQGRAQGFRP